MNLRIAGLCLLITLGTIKSIAQETLTDEELTKYATVMNWAKKQTTKMSKDVSAAVKADESLSGTAYKKISKAFKAGDANSTDATQAEVDAFMVIQNNTDKSKAEFKVVYVEKIGSDIGNGLYNRIKKALKTDDDVKARYQAIYDGLQAQEEEESGK